jgi:GT2 family glycosyltransferase
MKIGIAVTTTPCRDGVYNEWIKHLGRYVPTIHVYVHYDWQYKGIVYSKNKCIEMLYEAGCDHMFLFDDDTFIQSSDFITMYVKSGLNHACWNYNRTVLQFGIQATAFPPNHEPILKEYVELDKPNGCMLYVRREVIETVGGWDEDFKGYGYDHVNWSDRIFNNGLTPARYIDIPNSSHLFGMADCETSVSYDIRVNTIPINEKLYQQKFYSKEFKPFK